MLRYLTVKLIHMLSNILAESLAGKQMTNAIMHPFARILETSISDFYFKKQNHKEKKLVIWFEFEILK